MQVEHVDFLSVPVRDLDASTRWYADTLGLEQTGHGQWPEFRLGDNAFLYLLDPRNLGEEFEGANTGPIALRVADVAEARRELEEKGIEFVTDVMDSGVCHMAAFSDPDGNRFLLHRRYAPQDGEAA